MRAAGAAAAQPGRVSVLGWGGEGWGGGAGGGRSAGPTQRGEWRLRKGPERLSLAGGRVDPQDASPSRRVVPCSGGGDRSAWRASGFLATPTPKIHSEKTHVVAVDNCA